MITHLFFLLSLFFIGCDQSNGSGPNFSEVSSDQKSSSDEKIEESVIYELFVTDKNPWPADRSTFLNSENIEKHYVPSVTQGQAGHPLQVYVLRFGDRSPKIRPLVVGNITISKDGTLFMKSEETIIMDDLIRDKGDIYQIGEGSFRFEIPIANGEGRYDVKVVLNDRALNRNVTLEHSIEVPSETVLREQRLSGKYPKDFSENGLIAELVLVDSIEKINRVVRTRQMENLEEELANMQRQKVSVGENVIAAIVIRNSDKELQQINGEVLFRMYDPSGREVARVDANRLMSSPAGENSDSIAISPTVMLVQVPNSFVAGDYLFTAEIVGHDFPDTKVLGKRISLVK